jgi:hypothetical protein
VRLALLVTLVCGCSFEPRFDDGYRCVPDLPCPDGTTCVGGFCSADAPADDGAPPAADASPTIDCVGSTVFADDFSATLDADSWVVGTEGDAEVLAVGGHLEIAPHAPSSSGRARTEPDFALAGTSITVEVFESDEVTMNSQALEVLANGIPVVSMTRYRGSLRVELNGDESIAEVTWNGITHHLWRIVITGDAMSFQTAPEPGLFTELVGGPAPVFGKAQLRLSAGNYESNDPPPQAFDNLRVCQLPLP